MYLDTLTDGNESEDRVAVDRVAAMSQFEIDALEVLIDNQHIVALLHQFLGRILKLKILCTFCRLVGIGEVQVVVAFLYVSLDDAVHVDFLLGYILIEV